MSELRAFDPDAILKVLHRHDVRFILIGGIASQAHGSPSLTGDLAICYARVTATTSSVSPPRSPGFDYERLLAHAITATVHGARVQIASLSDLIDMKRAAGRPKDRIELEILGALREELDRQD